MHVQSSQCASRVSGNAEGISNHAVLTVTTGQWDVEHHLDNRVWILPTNNNAMVRQTIKQNTNLDNVVSVLQFSVAV